MMDAKVDARMVPVVLVQVRREVTVRVTPETARSGGFALGMRKLGWDFLAVDGVEPVGSCECCGRVILDGERSWSDDDGVWLCEEHLPTLEEEARREAEREEMEEELVTGAVEEAVGRLGCPECGGEVKDEGAGGVCVKCGWAYALD